MAKKFYDNSESKRLADLEILPYSHFLYMTLRLSFDKSPDCGLFKVTVKEMISITGMDRSVITDVLLPELTRHELITYDNGVVFIPGTAEAEGFEKKLHSNNPHHKTAFINALRECETVVSIASGYGGVNLAVRRFVEYWSSSIDLLISDMAVLEHELSELEQADKSQPSSPERNKRIYSLKKSIAEFYSCRTIQERKRSYSQGNANPSTTHAEPLAEKTPTHLQPIYNPSTTHAEPIPQKLPTPLGNGNGIGIGIWDKNKEIPFGIPGGAGENFLPPQGDFFAGSIEGGHVPDSPAEHGYLRTETKQDDPEVSTMLESHDLDFSTYNEGNSYGQSFSEHELRDYGLVSDDPFEVGAEGDDSEFFDSDTD